ncbi:pleckstrin homology domain-containing family B member 2-like [Platysternon megacephalum]|uniref:Pleckstrin homology domain-containing family B member 2-like n=1 Tax=Platysternon megacephalum TaxID=55544 RepID=A0A4D9ELP7_9SAUR|nr:pleckstrin homology domain-containing family B member 2-like [Platysternon megacephalum]
MHSSLRALHQMVASCNEPINSLVQNNNTLTVHYYQREYPMKEYLLIRCAVVIYNNMQHQPHSSNL